MSSLTTSSLNIESFDGHDWNFLNNHVETESALNLHWSDMYNFDTLTSGSLNIANSENENDLIGNFTTYDHLFEGLIDCNTSGNQSFTGFDWKNTSDDMSPSSLAISYTLGNGLNNQASGSDTKKRKQQSNFEFCSNWSLMNLQERTESVNYLTSIINERLDVREQLEVTRLVNPSNHHIQLGVFTIDISCIDDYKWGQIIEYIHQRLKILTLEENNENKKLKKMPELLKSQEKCVLQRQTKEYKQRLKEKRSGLFLQEEVLVLEKNEDISFEDIDVLD